MHKILIEVGHLYFRLNALRACRRIYFWQGPSSGLGN